MPPLIEHIRNLRGRDRLAIHRPDHEVMGFEVVHPMAFVGLDSLIELVETITKLLTALAVRCRSSRMV